ncbi:UNVERIFIED_CONTAM: Zfand5 [Trichonephila clavipes]
MERDTNQMSQSPSLCRSGCGFYGSPKTDGLCSKCYKDALKRKQANPAPPQISGRSSPTASAAVSNLSLLHLKLFIRIQYSVSKGFLLKMGSLSLSSHFCKW